VANYLLLLDALETPKNNLGDQLSRDGFVVRTGRDLESTVDLLERAPAADLILIRAAGAHAIELSTTLRTLCSVPIVVLCVDYSGALAIECLEAGADSVFPECLPRRELAARVDALLRRGGTPSGTPRRDVYHTADLVVDADAHFVSKGGRRLSLTRTEFRLVAALARRAGTLVSTGDLLTEVWGQASPRSSDNLRLYIRRLRRKLGDDSRHPRLILNQRRVGYRLKDVRLLKEDMTC